jgi:hypothetical protein
MATACATKKRFSLEHEAMLGPNREPYVIANDFKLWGVRAAITQGNIFIWQVVALDNAPAQRQRKGEAVGRLRINAANEGTARTNSHSNAHTH